jgi:hypothetical protein
MTLLPTLEQAAGDLGVVLLVLLLAAWMLEDILARATRVVDSFLIPLVDRLGDLGAAWRRLLTALHAARARWHG